MENKEILVKLNKIQTELKANKNQYNSFGRYAYRSCEDILESLKPLLLEYKAVINIADDIKQIGDRYYIVSTATIFDVESGESLQSTSFAREPETKKGMDVAQVTGATSSYARKYALNGLLAIDDNKDQDFLNKGQESQPRGNKKQSNKANNMTLSQAEKIKYGNKTLKEIAKEDIGAIKKLYKNSQQEENKKACYLILKEYKRQQKEMEEIQEATKQSDFFGEDFKPVNE